MEFKELGISPDILKALNDEGYESPTPIQEKTIPQALLGKDVLGLAQTGTGKTAAFAVPTLQLLGERIYHGKNRKIRSLVLTPTRELGLQIYESFRTYGRYLPLKATVVFGGVSQGKQVSALRSGVDVLIATPGRLADLIGQGYVDLSHVEIFILDEADQMLDMGFIHDIRRLVERLPKQRQTLFFSATMPKEIAEIVDELLVDPVQVSVAPVSSTVETVEQFVQFVDQNNKINLLANFLKETNGQPVLVFTRTKRGADRVVKDLGRRNIQAAAIHGNKSQNARQAALDSFKNYDLHVLVATDIASRGIDINELNYVVNYDMPDISESYVHRIGRTGRAGNKGKSLSFVSYREIPLLKDIEKLIKKTITVLDNSVYPMVDESEKPKQNRAKQSSKQPKPKHTEGRKKDDGNARRNRSSEGKERQQSNDDSRGAFNRKTRSTKNRSEVSESKGRRLRSTNDQHETSSTGTKPVRHKPTQDRTKRNDSKKKSTAWGRGSKETFNNKTGDFGKGRFKGKTSSKKQTSRKRSYQ